MKLYYVIKAYDYDGYGDPTVFTNLIEAYSWFNEEVSILQADKYGADDIYLFEQDSETKERIEVECYDHSAWRANQNAEEWKRLHPGQELPVYNPVMQCTTSPVAWTSDMLEGAALVTIGDPTSEVDYDKIAQDLGETAGQLLEGILDA